MKLFNCPSCANTLYFDNDTCVHCGTPVAFDPLTLEFKPIALPIDGSVNDDSFHYCESHLRQACNWAINDTFEETLCLSCYLNNTIPNLSTDTNISRWKKLETAKRRLLYSLYQLNLPITKKDSPGAVGLLFDFLEDESFGKRILTGHQNGLITVNIEEADDLERLQNKLQLDEKYRTVLGHFRHEVGHYYWEVFFNTQENLTEFRNYFGDERVDYNQALQNHYANGETPDWEQYYISSYAASHPWEDWAETWAHYLHMMDTLETAYYFGVAVQPATVTLQPIGRSINRDPYQVLNFSEIMDMWHPLTLAMNSLNRSMGYTDFYSFYISPAVIGKLAFIHEFCWRYRRTDMPIGQNISDNSIPSE